MNKHSFYNFSLMLSLLSMLLLVATFPLLTGNWLIAHIGIAFMLIILLSIGIVALYNEESWAPSYFLILFAVQAIDGFYLLSVSKYWLIYAYIAVSIFSLYKIGMHADIYKKDRKKEFFNVKYV